MTTVVLPYRPPRTGPPAEVLRPGRRPDAT